MTEVVLLPAWLEPPELPGLRYVFWDRGEPLPDVADVTVFIPPYMPVPEDLRIAARMPRLRMVQALMAGVDSFVAHLPDVEIRRAVGVHDTSTAELALGLILAAQRGIDVAARDMGGGRWRHARRPALADSRVAVVGWGGVGRAIGRRLDAFEVEVTGFNRSNIADFDPAAFDIVVLALPALDGAFMTVDRLARMNDGALLVNVGRGSLVDTQALLAALPRIRAALDVTDPEPLPPDHPLWQAPGVLITAHLGGDSEAFVPRAQAMVAQFLSEIGASHTAGEPLPARTTRDPGREG